MFNKNLKFMLIAITSFVLLGCSSMETVQVENNQEGIFTKSMMNDYNTLKSDLEGKVTNKEMEFSFIANKSNYEDQLISVGKVYMGSLTFNIYDNIYPVNVDYSNTTFTQSSNISKQDGFKVSGEFKDFGDRVLFVASKIERTNLEYNYN